MSYAKIISILTICPGDLEGSDDFYKQRFVNIVKTLSKDFMYQLRIEVLMAIKAPNWSWKAAAEESEFYAYDPNESENHHFEAIKFIIWDSLFRGLNLNVQEE